MKTLLLVFLILVVLAFLGIVAVALLSKTGRGVHTAVSLLRMVLLAMGVSLVVYAVSNAINDAALKRNAVFTTGTIIHYEDIEYHYGDERTTGTYFVYQYQADGREYRKTNGNEDVTNRDYGTTASYYARPRFRAEKLGETIDIYYPPGRPRDAMPVSTATTVLVVCLLVGGTMAYFAARSLWRGSRPSPAKQGKKQKRRR